MFALATTPADAAPAALAVAAPSSPVASGEAQQPTVYGVFKVYNWQLYGGYSFFRFYITSKPSITENMNGIDFGIVYFPGGNWLGVEGQFVGEFGSLYGESSEFAAGLGGPRFRWSAPRGVELWGHVMVGGTKFIPQTPYGGQTAFAYEAGGGVDVGAHRRRIAYRLEADMVGTRYFSTYQFSPRFSVGIVFKY